MAHLTIRHLASTSHDRTTQHSSLAHKSRNGNNHNKMLPVAIRFAFSYSEKQARQCDQHSISLAKDDPYKIKAFHLQKRS